MLPLITGSSDSENSQVLGGVGVSEGVPVAVAVGVGVGDGAGTNVGDGAGIAVGDGVGVAVGDGIGTDVVVGVAVDVASGVPLAGLQPASTASATVQNHLSPFDSSISVRA